MFWRNHLLYSIWQRNMLPDCSCIPDNYWTDTSLQQKLWSKTSPVQFWTWSDLPTIYFWESQKLQHPSPKQPRATSRELTNIQRNLIRVIRNTNKEETSDTDIRVGRSLKGHVSPITTKCLKVLFLNCYQVIILPNLEFLQRTLSLLRCPSHSWNSSVRQTVHLSWIVSPCSSQFTWSSITKTSTSHTNPWNP